jgi:hypothetical protein
MSRNEEPEWPSARYRNSEYAGPTRVQTLTAPTAPPQRMALLPNKLAHTQSASLQAALNMSSRSRDVSVTTTARDER